MGSWNRPDRELLEAAYTAWPGTDNEKTAQKALLIRLRIEDVARGLPTSVIAGPSGSDRIRQRLVLSVGAPNLAQTDRERRLAVVRAAVRVYKAICGVLHGRDPEGRPPLADVIAWDKIIGELERELRGQAPVPSPRVLADEREPGELVSFPEAAGIARATGDAPDAEVGQ